jgi:hypothetical protein
VSLDVTSVLRQAELPVKQAFMGLVDIDSVPNFVPPSHMARMASTLSIPLLEVCHPLACWLLVRGLFVRCCQVTIT